MKNKQYFSKAEIQVEALIENSKDKRIKVGIERVQEACVFLLKEGKSLKKEAIGQYCEDKYNSPKIRTIYNDPNKIYAKVIAFYESYHSKDINEPTGLTKAELTYYRQLEIEVESLRNILQKQFLQAGEEKVNLNEIVKYKANEKDGAKRVLSSISTTQRDVIEKLLESFLELDDFALRGGEHNQLVEIETGYVVLEAREYRILRELLDNAV